MFSIEEIYNKFDKIGSVVFSTIDNDYPETRIAHFLHMMKMDYTLEQ